MKKRILALILTASLLLSGIVSTSPKASAAFENTYVNTGNQIEDLIGVAMTQVGYTEGRNNDTKYGDWMGLSHQPWCAMFISWCARQADIPTSVLQNSAWASPGSHKGFDIPCYDGTEYTPKRGDLFFTWDYAHVGIVLGVEGELVRTLEANTNNDGSEDGYYVMIRHRVIAECHFGTPPYQGVDKEHTYVREYDTAHPHAGYYRCTTCGDTYYTGTKTHLTDCSDCMNCSCTTEKAGWYRVDIKNRLTIRSGHGTGYGYRGFLEDGEAVYVVAAGRSWAHIIYANTVGYVSLDYLEPFVPVPRGLTAHQDTYYKGDTAGFTWDPVSTAVAYNVTLLRDGVQVVSENAGNVTSYELPGLTPGQYELRLTATDGTLISDPAALSLTVLDAYTVTYDAMGGTDAPEAQIRHVDKVLTLSDAVPAREGFRFLGWQEDPSSDYAAYQPGDTWEGTADTTLYALWQSETAAAVSLEILTPADRTLFVVGGALDTSGLELKLSYDDGTARIITQGFETSGFVSDTPKTCIITVTYEGISTSYAVEVLEYLPGDIDLNLMVDKEDVMQLLWHVSFPELYPIEVPADFTGDGILDKEDVMQLLWHVSFPDMYPLM